MSRSDSTRPCSGFELQPTGHRRFAWSLDEVSGALGDLGTFLPHIIGAITVVGMDPTGIFTSFGLFYALSGAFYSIPMAVQPMKAASAAVLIQPMDPGSVAGAGLVIGALFLILGASGLVGRIARALPPTIAAGLQLGLGLSLAALGIRLVEERTWLGLVVCALMLGLMRFSRVPVALIAVVAGAAFGIVSGISPPLPPMDVGAVEKSHAVGGKSAAGEAAATGRCRSDVGSAAPGSPPSRCCRPARVPIGG